METGTTESTGEDNALSSNNVGTHGNTNDTLANFLFDICSDTNDDLPGACNYDNFLDTPSEGNTCAEEETSQNIGGNVDIYSEKHFKKQETPNKKKRKLELYSAPPKSPILPKKTGKVHKIKTNPDQWISRENAEQAHVHLSLAQSVFEKESFLPLRILSARRNAVFFRYPPLKRHQYSPASDSSDSIYVLDQKFRMRSLDQIDFLFRLGASSCFYIKKHGHLNHIEDLLDKINKCVYTHCKSIFLSGKSKDDENVFRKVINIEFEGRILTECLCLIIGIHKLCDASNQFNHLRKDLKVAGWHGMPSDYSRYVNTAPYLYINPFQQREVLNKSLLF